MNRGSWKSHRSTWQSWADMKQRCLNPRSHNYHNYGGRGITVCDRWLSSFQLFFQDMGQKPEGLTLERINTNGNYEPGNCKWANRLDQRRNQRDCIYLDFNGERKTLQQWADQIGLNRSTIKLRLDQGLPANEILSAIRRNGDRRPLNFPKPPQPPQGKETRE